jgi:hypothetical protein
VEATGSSHEEVAPRLSAYAAGTLDRVHARAVQAHLASGCPACLDEVFRRPVGMTRAAPARRGRRRLVVAAFMAILASVSAVATMLVVRERQLRQTRVADTLARVAEAARREAELRDRLVVAKMVLRSQRRVADTEQEILARGAEEASREAETLRQRLRAGRRRVAELEAEVAGGRLAGDVVASEGLELRSLRPTSPSHGVSGHVLWRPADGEMVVYAFGLPAAPAGVGYEARAIVGNGRELRTQLRRSSDGRAFAYLLLPPDARTVHTVEVRRMADARRLLLAEAAP